MDDDLTGTQKAAVLLRAMGESRSNRLKLDLDKDEIEELREAEMSLGKVSSGVVENILSEYGVKREAMPMNQPQNIELRRQQEEAQARANVQKRRPAKPAPQAPKAPQASQASQAPKAAQAKPDDDTPSPVQHLTNIEV
jgi:hypothetical protein